MFTKRASVFGVLAISFIALMMFSFVSAQFKPNTQADLGAQDFGSVTSFFGKVLNVMLGDYRGGQIDGGTELLFAKLLLLILVFAIVYAVLSSADFGIFAGKTWLVWIVSIIVAILSVRFLTPEFISLILIPNTTLGIVLTAGLPFVIFAAVVFKFKSSTQKRIAWIFFAAVFTGLWIYRLGDLGGFNLFGWQVVESTSSSEGSAGWVYPLVAILSLIMAVFDGTITNLLTKIRGEKALAEVKSQELIDLRQQLADASQKYAAGSMVLADYEAKKKNITQRIKVLST